MLTKQDLQQIKEVVNSSIDSRVGVIVEEKVNASIDSRVGDIVERKIDSRVGVIVEEKVNASIDSRVGDIVDQRLDKKLKPVKKQLAYLAKTLDIAINMFNKDDIKLEKRVKFIEDHLGIQHKN